MGDDKTTLAFATKDDWRAWLADNHANSTGVWIRLSKKGSRIPSVTYGEALDVALCYGWIDGQSKGVDDKTYVQKFTPRAKRSMWSKRNREKVANLIAGGEMQPAGLAEIKRAKADGRWDAAYDSPSTATVPEDLEAALDANPAAQEFFASLNSANRFAVLHRIQTAKKPQTRAKRIADLVDKLARGEKIHP